MRNDVITIDGPAGSGKSTVAKIVADNMGYFYLDTGAMYRTVAVAIKDKRVNTNDEGAIRGLLDGLTFEIRKDEKGKMRYIINNTDITDKIRESEVTKLSSDIARMRNVRKYLEGLQRQFVLKLKGGLVAEGRDMGTRVFPEAKHKFFLNAEIEERARRRFRELAESRGDVKISYDEVLESIIKRDKQDMERKESPLYPSINAVIINTTKFSPHEIAGKIMKVLRKPST